MPLTEQEAGETARAAWDAVERATSDNFVDALEHLLRLTDGATQLLALRYRGLGLNRKALVHLALDMPQAALGCLCSAFDLNERLRASGADAETLGLEMAGLPLQLLGHVGGAARRGYDVLFMGVLDHVLPGTRAGECGDATPAESARLLERLKELSLGSPESIRCIAASYGFGIGNARIDDKLSGWGMSWYMPAVRLLESIREYRPLCVALAQSLYGAIAFERQRGSDLTAMRATYDQFDRYLRTVRLPTEERLRRLTYLRCYSEIAAAMRDAKLARAAGYAREMVRAIPAGDDLWSAGDLELAQWLDSLPTDVDLADCEPAERARLQRGALNLVSRFASEGTEQGIAQAYVALTEADATEDADAYFTALLKLLFSEDRLVRWRTAATLMLSTVDRYPESFAASLAILFGKLAVRELQFMRLEAMARSFANLNVFQEDMALRACGHLERLLTDQGRVGEALRLSALVELDQHGVPAPHLKDIASAVESSVSLDPFERRANAGLEVLIDSLNQTGEIIPDVAVEELARVMHELRSAGQSADTLNEFQNWPCDTACLAVSVTADKVSITLSGRFGVERRTVAAASAEVNRLTFATLRAVHDASRENVSRSCKALHDLLIAPVRDVLEREKVMTIVVQTGGALRRVPFGVLFDGETYLIERYAIVMHPLVTTVAPDRGIRHPYSGTSLSISRTPGFPDLPGAARDAEVLNAIARANRVGYVECIADRDVTARAFSSAATHGVGILHVACHFEADLSNAGNSAFILGDGSRYTLVDLSRLDLSRIDLALILGCETLSVADSGGANGIDALDSLLCQMGVGSVLATAWRVRDQIAHEVLKVFAEELFSASANQAQALRRAQLQVGRDAHTAKMGHPRDWGAFTLSGGWRGIRGE
jgi:CHAT domain-containing protein